MGMELLAALIGLATAIIGFSAALTPYLGWLSTFAQKLIEVFDGIAAQFSTAYEMLTYLLIRAASGRSLLTKLIEANSVGQNGVLSRTVNRKSLECLRRLEK